MSKKDETVGSPVSKLYGVLERVSDPQRKSFYTELLDSHPIADLLDEVSEKTPLKVCARIGDLAAGIVQLFIQHDKPDLEDVGDLEDIESSRRTALHIAAEENALLMASLLLDHGAKIDCKDADGRTPLHLASKNLHNQMIMLLRKHGASYKVTDLDGRTPVDLIEQPMSGCALAEALTEPRKEKRSKKEDESEDEPELPKKRGRPSKKTTVSSSSSEKHIPATSSKKVDQSRTASLVVTESFGSRKFGMAPFSSEQSTYAPLVSPYDAPILYVPRLSNEFESRATSFSPSDSAEGSPDFCDNDAYSR